MHPTYKRMLAGLKKEKRSSREKKTTADWSLYILRCCDGSFYTGITNNMKRRFKMHQDGKASRYTRTRRPVEILYSETCGDRSQALIRECEVKEWPRTKKEALVSGEWEGSRSATRRAQRAKRNVQRKTRRVSSCVKRSALRDQ